MNGPRGTFSICIPAYNRSHRLASLLDSLLTQDYTDFNVVICEDDSPERKQIREIVAGYASRFPGKIEYHENETNLGYDGNLRRLVENATGKFCFFMGNDDLLCPGALAHVAALVDRRPNVGMVLKSYAWFDADPEKINQTIRYFGEEREFAPGREAVSVCFRRSGVLSGYIIDRRAAQDAATEKFDGSLFYQMHLTASVLCHRSAVFTPRVLVLCRNSEPPDFGNSRSEAGKYVPGRYTPMARVNMVGGALSIVRNLRETKNIDVVDEVLRDYANYFYPCIRDQLGLPLSQFWRLYRDFGRMGFSQYPVFHLQCWLSYLLGQRRCDDATRMLRKLLGRSPRWGVVR